MAEKQIFHADASLGFTVKQTANQTVDELMSESGGKEADQMRHVAFLVESIESHFKAIFELATQQDDDTLDSLREKALLILTSSKRLRALIQSSERNAVADFIATQISRGLACTVPAMQELGISPEAKIGVVRAMSSWAGRIYSVTTDHLKRRIRSQKGSQNRRQSDMENKDMKINLEALTIGLHDMLMSTPSVEKALGYKDASAYFRLAAEISKPLAENRSIKLQDLSEVKGIQAAQFAFIVRIWFKKQQILKYA